MLRQAGTMISPNEVLKFWFEELDPKMHFSKSTELDQMIRESFLEHYESIVAGETTSWRKTPEGRLAEVIVLDQFSRNMFRDTAQAFAADDLALKLAMDAVKNGDDLKFPLNQRVYFYMPYMHSENRHVHEKAVQLFSQKGLEYSLKFEFLHKSIIDRFGRYPHRNEILNRQSTPEELMFLKEKGSVF